MKTTSKTSTIRSNGIQVTNLTGNQTLYSSDSLFYFGANKRPAIIQSNGRYEIVKQGQHAGKVEQPYSVCTVL